MDQAGLVHRLAHLLRSLNVNIESLDTHLAPAPITGTPLFEMEMFVSVPKDTALATLRQKLGGLCDQFNIDWQLTAM
jgi:glycine cleavage system transcriptional repressor